MRVASYTRISLDEEHQPFSLPAQKERIEAYCKSQGNDWVWAKHYEDMCTGTILERKGLQEMLKGARNSEFDCLLVFRVDRLSRNVRQISQIVEELDKVGVRFRSITEPFDTATSAGRMMMQMLAVFAEFEHATIVERTIVGMEKKAKLGGWNGGGIPFGYNYDIDKKQLIVNPDEAPIVKLSFEFYVDKKMGSTQIAQELNKRGYRTKAGNRWAGSGIIAMINRPVYAGKLKWRDIERAGQHLSLIDQAQWIKAHEILEDRSKNYRLCRANGTNYYLSRVTVCGRCGNHMIGVSAKVRGDSRYQYYMCTRRDKYSKDGCAQDIIPKDKIEKIVFEQLKVVFNDEGLLNNVLEKVNTQLQKSRPLYEKELASAENEIKEKEIALNRYFKSFESGNMAEEFCSERIKRVSEELKQLKEQRNALEGKIANNRHEMFKIDDLRNLARNFDEVMQSAPDSQKKATLEKMIKVIKVASKEEIKVTYILPLKHRSKKTSGSDRINSGSPAWARTRDTWITSNPVLLPDLDYIISVTRLHSVLGGRCIVSEPSLYF